MTDGIMAQLRVGTRKEHAAIEETTLGRALLHGEVDAPTYAAQLEAYLVLHEALEQQARAHVDDRRSWLLAGSVLRARLLRSDLSALRGKRDLGSPLAGPADARTRALAHAIASASLPAALGAAYVFEGSAMGNRQLAPALTVSLSLADDESAYYRGDGARAGHVFRAFAHEMDNLIVHPDDQRVALDGAVLVFGSLVDIFLALSPGEASQRFERAPAA